MPVGYYRGTPATSMRFFNVAFAAAFAAVLPLANAVLCTEPTAGNILRIKGDASVPFAATVQTSRVAISAIKALKTPLDDLTVEVIANRMSIVPGVREGELSALATYFAMLHYCERSDDSITDDWIENSAITADDLTIKLTGYGVRAIDLLLQSTPRRTLVICNSIIKRLENAEHFNGWTDGHKLVETILKVDDLDAVTIYVPQLLQLCNTTMVKPTTILQLLASYRNYSDEKKIDALLKMMLEYNHDNAAHLMAFPLGEIFKKIHTQSNMAQLSTFISWYNSQVWIDGVKRTLEVPKSSPNTLTPTSSVFSNVTSWADVCNTINFVGVRILAEMDKSNTWSTSRVFQLEAAGKKTITHNFLSLILERSASIPESTFRSLVSEVLSYPGFSITEFYADPDVWLAVANVFVTRPSLDENAHYLITTLESALVKVTKNIDMSFSRCICSAGYALGLSLTVDDAKEHAHIVGNAARYFHMLFALDMPYSSSLPPFFKTVFNHSHFNFRFLVNFNSLSIRPREALLNAIKYADTWSLRHADHLLQGFKYDITFAAEVVNILKNLVTSFSCMSPAAIASMRTVFDQAMQLPHVNRLAMAAHLDEAFETTSEQQEMPAPVLAASKDD